MRSAPRRALTAFLAVLILAVFASPGLAQKKKGKKTFSETTSVVAVEVPVTVIRDGEPVPDLTAENFEILDGRTPQEITEFMVIDLSKVESQDPLEQRIPVAARRHFLMVFDMAFSEPDSIFKARDAAMELVEQLHPSDLAGVMTYNSTTGAEIVLNFTSDRNQLRLAIDTLGVPEGIERARDPLGIVFGSAQDFANQGVVGSLPDGGARGAEARKERILEAVGRIIAAEKTVQRNKVSALTGNMEALALQMATLEGRKHLVYFSEGIPSDVIADPDISRGFSDVIIQATNDGTDSFRGSTDSSAIGQASASQNQLESMIEAFRRAGCVIQAVDIGGARTLNEIGGRASGEDSLVAMAKDTGGEFFRNFNDLGEAMDKMLERNSITYLLVFQPQNLKLDGDYHKLKVRLKDVPRGTRVSHRAGYYAPTEYSETTATQRRLETAELIMSDEDSGALAADLLVATFPVPGQKAYVPLLLELGGASLLEGEGSTLPLELYAYATDSNGSIYDFFTQTIGVDVGQAKSMLQQSGIKYWGHFDLPPGKYTARVLVRDRRDGRYALRQRPFVVPEAEQVGSSTFLPPLFPEPPTKWLLVREVEERQRQVDYPFMMAGQPYIPAVKPAVPAKGKTPFQFRGLNMSGEVDFTGEVVGLDGSPVGEAVLKLEPASPGAEGHTAMAELQTKGLAPGEYLLVGTATSAAGQQSSSIRFVVR